MQKKILKKLELHNPIVRNVVVIVGIILGLVVLGLASGIINALLKFLLGLGWKLLIAIGATAIICGAVFGYAEMRTHGYVSPVKDDEDEDDDF